MNPQEIFRENLKYINQLEVDVDVIKRQFVKSPTRLFLTVGQVDCPSGKIVVADPLYYLPTGNICPQMEVTVPPGTYSAEVAICRNLIFGIRMCTARLKIKESEAVKYERALPTEETAASKGPGGIWSGFPVDAGVMAFCDAEVAVRYREFWDRWCENHPSANIYNDYFAEFFVESSNRLPAYQRRDGDFIEWTNPDSGDRLVMIASGFGDGFYQVFWGYDREGEACELIVPMVNPDLIEKMGN